MSDFKVVSEVITGEIEVIADTQFNNIRAEKIIIMENVKVRLFGSVNEVVLHKGSTLFLHGRVDGKVKNYGGELFTFYL